MFVWWDFALRQSPDFQATLFNNKTGAGSCAKCHVAGSGSWTQAAAPVGHTIFSHGVHNKFLNNKCETCHMMVDSAEVSKQIKAGLTPLQKDAKPVSSFAGIKMETCSQCHAEKKVLQDCRLCHRYHLE